MNSFLCVLPGGSLEDKQVIIIALQNCELKFFVGQNLTETIIDRFKKTSVNAVNIYWRGLLSC